MNCQIVYVGENVDLVEACQFKFRESGCQLLDVADFHEAKELLARHAVDILCIDSHVLTAEDMRGIARLKSQTPHLAVLLIHAGDGLPSGAVEFVDVVMNAPDFVSMGRQLAQQLAELRFPVFVEWFDEWRRRCA